MSLFKICQINHKINRVLSLSDTQLDHLLRTSSPTVLSYESSVMTHFVDISKVTYEKSEYNRNFLKREICGVG